MADNERVNDIGMLNPSDIKGGVAYATFGSFLLHDHPIDDETGHSVDVKVPVPVAALEAAGVELDNPDPYDNPSRLIFFEASIKTPAATAEGAEPRDIRALPHASEGDIAAWEGRNLA